MPSTPRQLEGYRQRLERELQRAMATQPPPAKLVDRLTRELADSDKQLASRVPVEA